MIILIRNFEWASCIGSFFWPGSLTITALWVTEDTTLDLSPDIFSLSHHCASILWSGIWGPGANWEEDQSPSGLGLEGGESQAFYSDWWRVAQRWAKILNPSQASCCVWPAACPSFPEPLNLPDTWVSAQDCLPVISPMGTPLQSQLIKAAPYPSIKPLLGIKTAQCRSN